MRRIFLGVAASVGLFGAAVFGATTADAQAPPVLSDAPLCNILTTSCGPTPTLPGWDPSPTSFDDPRYGTAPTGNPNPILVFIIPPTPGSVIIPAAGGNDMNQNYCQVAYRMTNC